jgi:beta-lactamase regulating signal transducer with metallopeptidase domain
MSDFPMALDVVAIKATLVLVGAMLVAYSLRRASGNSRHTLWTATTLALLALPLLESVLPRLTLAWLPAALPTEQILGASPAAVTSVGAVEFASGAADRLVDVSPSPATGIAAAPSRGLGFWFAMTWLLGAVGFAIPVLVGVLRSRRVMAVARDVEDGPLQAQFDRARALVGVSTPVALRVSPEVRTPMTGGVMHPMVLLPESALGWSDDCADAVLRHELVHVRQRDALRQLGSRLSVAFYWFHPLAWRAARLGALAREMACDEAVLRLGTRPSRYARHLLALADPLPAPVAPALVRLDHPHLEERVMAILRASPPPASRRLSISAALIIFTWTAVVAAAAPTVRDAVAETPSEATTEYPVEFAALPADLELPALASLDPLEELSALQVPTADCEPSRDGRTRAVSGASSGVRMFTTDHEGTRICVTVRGDSDRDGFLPRGRLPNGVLLTMATNNSDGDRRLEIEGTSAGNQHRWFVNGRESAFNSDAAEWRDAMFDLIGVLTERNAADRVRAVEAMGVARNEMERARVAMGRSMAAEERAIARAHANADVAEQVARRVEERRVAAGDIRAREVEVAGHAAEIRAHAMAEVAEAHARAAADVAHHMDEVTATGVSRSGGRAVVAPRAAGGGRGTTAPRAAARSADMDEMRAREVEGRLMRNREHLEANREHLEARLHEMEANRDAMTERRATIAEHAEELREHAREMAREHERMAEDVRRVAPVISEGRAGARLREVPVPRAPRAAGGMQIPTPPRAPRAVTPLEEREQDPRAQEAAGRLRTAIRVTGET